MAGRVKFTHQPHVVDERDPTHWCAGTMPPSTVSIVGAETALVGVYSDNTHIHNRNFSHWRPSNQRIVEVPELTDEDREFGREEDDIVLECAVRGLQQMGLKAELPVHLKY